MKRLYAIVIILLQAYFCFITMQMADAMPSFFPSLREIYLNPNVQPPFLSSFVCHIAPYSWLVPCTLLGLTAFRWKKADDKVFSHTLLISIIIFMAYMTLCAVGFSLFYIDHKLAHFV